MAETVATPEVLWAQRSSATEADKNFVYLTVSVPDVSKEDLKVELKATGLSFKGYSSTLKRKYELELEFWGEIDVENSKQNHTNKNIEFKLQKKELKEEYWPRLIKGDKRMHFIKTDFDKWVDEDEQNEAPEDDFSQFGGMGGMPGMGAGGMGGGDFGGIDFSKLGGGMPGMEGMEGMGGEDVGSDDEDDDDMPALEGEEEAKPAAEKKA